MRNLDFLPGLIDKVFPLPARFRPGLKLDVADLSRLLTSERPERGSSYLGRPALLSAYLRYFLPWNIYRLSRLFSIIPLDLKPNDAINDIGAGPLTLAASLWISRPDLRTIPIEFRCLDRTSAVLEAGKKLFAALSEVLPPRDGGLSGLSGLSGDSGLNSGCPWTIKIIRGELKRNGALSVEIRGKPAALSAAVNVYNEIFWNFPYRDEDELVRFADNQARLLSSLTESSGSVLVVEPGIPRSGEFISLLRSSLMNENRFPVSPCTHSGSCPLPANRFKNNTGTGGKAKWCHFAFDTESAPPELHQLSAAARLPKERAVLSYILAGPVSLKKENTAKSAIAFPGTDVSKKPHQKKAGLLSPGMISGGPVKIRIISDSFPVDGGAENDHGATRGAGAWGRYGCCEHGLVLVTGNRENIEKSPSGCLEELRILSGSKDAKSGALVAEKKSGK